MSSLPFISNVLQGFYIVHRQKKKILSLFHGHDRLKSLVDEDQACAASYVPSYVLLCEPADASVTLDQFMLWTAIK